MSLWRVWTYTADGGLHTKLISADASVDKKEDLDFFASDETEREFRGEVEIEDDTGLLDSDESFDS